jgi:YbbR domain-containing protein
MKRFKEILFENRSLKLMALLLALLLWLFVRAEPGPVRVVAVPLEVQLSRNMEITNERPSTVEVTMRGAAFSTMWFSQPLPTCIINLTGAAEGEHVVNLTPENIRIPKGTGIDILQVNPARVRLVLEKTITKEVPIAVPTKGEPARGYEIYGRFSKPATTLITGPRSHVDQTDEVQTEPVNINGQKQSVRSFVSLNIKDNTIRTSVSEPVQADIQIGPRRKTYTISPVPVHTDDPSFTTAPRQILLRVTAPVDMRKELAPKDFSATVAARNLDSSKLPMRVQPSIKVLGGLNGTVIIKEVEPSEVIVRKSHKR